MDKEEMELFAAEYKDKYNEVVDFLHMMRAEPGSVIRWRQGFTSANCHEVLHWLMAQCMVFRHLEMCADEGTVRWWVLEMTMSMNNAREVARIQEEHNRQLMGEEAAKLIQNMMEGGCGNPDCPEHGENAVKVNTPATGEVN